MIARGLAAWRGATNLAGGWRYHLAALRWRRSLWAAYTAQVASFLAGWRPDAARLVIVGPSAGWHLPGAWLARFEGVTAVEPDPIARWLLRRRFPAVAWTFDVDDYFQPDHPAGWSANLTRLFDSYPGDAILFANFLGQLVGLHPQAVGAPGTDPPQPSRVFQHWKQEFNRQCQGRAWASLHDRYSAAVPPVATAPPADGFGDGRHWFGADAAVADHLTIGLGGGPASTALVWQRTPRMWHVVEAVRANGTAPPARDGRTEDAVRSSAGA